MKIFIVLVCLMVVSCSKRVGEQVSTDLQPQSTGGGITSGINGTFTGGDVNDFKPMAVEFENQTLTFANPLTMKITEGSKNFSVTTSSPKFSAVLQSGTFDIFDLRLETCNSSTESGDGIVTFRDAGASNSMLTRTFHYDCTVPDNAAPLAPTVRDPASGTSLASATFNLKGTCEAGALLKVTGALVTPGVNPPMKTELCQSGNTYDIAITLNGVTDGRKDLSILQVDPSNNSSPANAIFYILDTSPPSKPGIDAEPADKSVVTVRPQTFSGSCESNARVIISGSINPDNVEQICTGARYSILVNLTAGAGEKNISIRQVDPAGHVSDPESRLLNLQTPIVDTERPADPVILSPALNERTVKTRSMIIQIGCEPGASVSVTGALSNWPAAAVCPAGGTLAVSSALLTAGDGVKDMVVTQTDAAGNTNLRPTLFKMELDTLAPEKVAITSPDPAEEVNSRALSFQGRCEAKAKVYFVGDFAGSPKEIICPDDTDLELDIQLTSGDGAKNIEIYQIDAALLKSPSLNLKYTLDTAAPADPALDAPNPSDVSNVNQVLHGTCSAPSFLVFSGDIESDTVTVACPAGGHFSVSIQLTACPIGDKTVSVYSIDAAGNMSDDRSISFNLDYGDAQNDIKCPEGEGTDPGLISGEAGQLRAGANHFMMQRPAASPTALPTFYGWGNDTYGQVGDGVDSNVPPAVNPKKNVVQILPPAGMSYWNFGMGADHTCAVTQNSKLQCWGRDQWGQLGNGPATSDSLQSPALTTVANYAVTPTTKPNVKPTHNYPAYFNFNFYPNQVWTGEDHTCVIGRRTKTAALTSAGYLATYCWGRNEYGQTGVTESAFSKTTSITYPRPIPKTGGNGSNGFFAMMALGRDHTCAVGSGAKPYVYCWGRKKLSGHASYVAKADSKNGVFYKQSKPVYLKAFPLSVKKGSITYPIKTTALVAGTLHTCLATRIADEEDKVWCWGVNSAHQLGSGVLTSEAASGSLPVRVGFNATNNVNNFPLVTVDELAAKANGTCAYGSRAGTTQKTIICWGEGYSTVGNLFREFPAVLSGVAISKLQMTTNGFCGVGTNKRVYCRGKNDLGQLGNGTLVDHLTDFVLTLLPF